MSSPVRFIIALSCAVAAALLTLAWVAADDYTLWQDDGVDVAVTTGIQRFPRIISDELGGAIIVWEDTRNISTEFDIYAQRVAADGSRMWTPNGVSLSVASGHASIREMRTISAA